MGLDEADAEAVLVYSTFPDMEQAKTVADALVRSGLAACVNILPGMVSVYIWEGAVEEAQEVVVLVKTVSGRVMDVMEAIGDLHPYENPALLVLPTAGGARDYLEWIVAATQIMPDKPH